MKQAVRIVTATATLYGSEDIIVFDSAVAINFNMGHAHGDGRSVSLKNKGAGVVTVLPLTGETINDTVSLILDSGESVQIVDDVVDEWVAIYTTGTNLTPVARTNNPIVGASSLGANIGKLDAAIGVDVVPVSRTNNPILAANAVNANIDVLDAAIGANASPVARTTGPIAVANTVNQNIDALDSAIGFEGQMSGSPNVVTFPTTVFQALDKLDTYKSVQTVKRTIGAPGITGVNFNFASAANQSEQVIDLGEIIPAKAKILHAFTYTDAVFTGAVSLVAETGISSSGAELIASATIMAANAITEPNAAGLSPIAITAAAKHIYVSATPGANWSTFSAGSISVYITFINFHNI